jgi:mannose-6-phosphate isomerase-like protein (cupin superfamily)
VAQIRIPDVSELRWYAPRDWNAPRDGIDLDVRDVVVDAGAPSEARVHHSGKGTELQLLEVRVQPDEVIEAHAHANDEIIWVLEGELKLGARVLGPGESVYIPGWTLYGLQAGPAGLRFLNFRARNDVTYITKEQFVAERASQRGTALGADT